MSRAGVSMAFKKRSYVEWLRLTGKPGQAQESLGVSRQLVYKWKQEDPQFAQRCQEAMDAFEAGKQQALQEAKANLVVREEQVWHEYAAVAFTELRDVMSWDHDQVRLIPSADLPSTAAAAIKSLDAVVTSYTEWDEAEGKPRAVTKTVLKVALHDKMRALDALERRFGLFRQSAEFLDGFVEVVLAHVDSEAGKGAILAYLTEHAGLKPPEPVRGQDRPEGGDVGRNESTPH